MLTPKEGASLIMVSLYYHCVHVEITHQWWGFTILCVHSDLFSGAGNASFLCPDNDFAFFGLSSVLIGCVLLPTIEITSKSLKHLHLQEAIQSSLLWLFPFLMCSILLDQPWTLERHVTFHSTMQKILFCSFPLYFTSAVIIPGSTIDGE